MFRLIGLFAIIPTAVLLTVSFFVLFTIRKIETSGLKAFGYVVTAVLWIAALLVFSAGVYTVYTGRKTMFCPKKEMMRGYKMDRSMPGMMREELHEPMTKH